ncbi:MAG: hypothetical protein Q8N91_05010 [Candidatus Omnitrophota bacterium]|nr:hypothetical protein [Candidatus Omnitrophota bacterium]
MPAERRAIGRDTYRIVIYVELALAVTRNDVQAHAVCEIKNAGLTTNDTIA